MSAFPGVWSEDARARAREHSARGGESSKRRGAKWDADRALEGLRRIFRELGYRDE